MKHTLPLLPYNYNALEPYYDEETLRVHHDKHHNAYVNGLNNAEEKLNLARQNNDYALIKHWEREISFNGSGHVLHTMFWENMKPNGSIPAGEIVNAIKGDFGDYESFKQQFSAAALQVEGSGWALLCLNPMFNKLVILQVEKHQNLTQWGVIPILVLDVWEHAYYLKYKNNRGAFIEAWWNIVNWDIVNDRYCKAKNS